MFYKLFNPSGLATPVHVFLDRQTGRRFEYGRVNYRDAQNAQRALGTLNYSRISGRSWRTMRAQRNA